jgi:hypothetical protein
VSTTLAKTDTITLVPGEEIKLRIKRATIGVVLIWMGVGLSIAALTAAWIWFGGAVPKIEVATATTWAMPDFGDLILIINIFLVLVGLIATHVYRNNELVVTNKRAIQRTMISPFGVRLDTIDLSMIEDVSLRRDGLWQYICRVGTIRMSTVGEETTYTFKFVSTPEDEIDLITRLVHANQNGPLTMKKKGLR